MKVTFISFLLLLAVIAILYEIYYGTNGMIEWLPDYGERISSTVRLIDP